MYFIMKNLLRYICVIMVVLVNAEAGGHGEKHHDHVNLHVPEFIHHDHHTKVITIHHHHHKPKKEHHHHHHHHHKPHIPYGHHYHHHHKKSSTHSTSKGHSSHHGHKKHHGHHGHQGHHGHHGHHGHKHHDIPSYNYDTPSISYEPPAISYDPSPSFGDGYNSISSSVPNIPHSPHVHGVVHTVKQVKVFDSLPGAIPGVVASNTGGGYQVTEEGSEGEDDVFTSVNTLPQSYQGTYGFIRSAGGGNNDPFANIGQQGPAPAQNHDPFANAVEQPSFPNIESFTGQSNSFPPSAPSAEALPNISSVAPSGFDDPSNIIVGNDITGTALISGGDEINDESPVSYSREAGIQSTVKTGGIETLVY